MADGTAPERKATSLGRTALYRHFDADGKLLYVGISLSPTYRLSQHRDASLWFTQIVRVEIAWFDTREGAMAAEQSAIQAEKPLHNVMHARPTKEIRSLEMAEESAAELTRRVARFSTHYSIKAAAELLGISKHRIASAIVAGDIPHYCNGEKILISGWGVIAYMEALQDGSARVREPLVDAAGERIYLSEQRLFEHISSLKP